MITYVDSSNAKAYSALFSEAGLTVPENPTVDQLNGLLAQYINKLPDLIKVNPKFVRLPIDEDTFTIDGNTRTITIPTNFRSNGISMVGDELAEIVYFKINRYYDVTDFGASDKQIYVQWTNANNQQGISKAYAIDKVSDPEYIYFGWALTSSAGLTSKAGNIIFNVRIYSSATKYIQCLVSDAFSETKKYFIKSGDNYTRVYISESEYNLSPTTYYYSEETLTYSFATQNATVAVKTAQNFDILNATDLIIDNSSDLIAERIMGANIAHTPKIVTDLPTTHEVSEGELTAVATADDGELVYAKWFKDNVATSAFKKLTAVDGKYSTALTVSSVGEYYVIFMTTVEVVDLEDTEGDKVEYHTTSAQSISTICEIPAPVKIEIKTNLTARYVIGKTTIPTLITDAPTGDYSTSIVSKCDTEEGEYEPTSLTIETTKDESTDTATTTFVPTESGYYKLQMINKRNNTSVASEISTACRVTPEPKVDSVDLKAYDAEGKEITVTSSRKVDYAEGIQLRTSAVTTTTGSDSLKYKWFKVVGSEDPDPTGDDIELTEYTTENLTFPVVHTSAETHQQVTYYEGNFYGKVCNVLNEYDSEYSKEGEEAIIVVLN